MQINFLTQNLESPVVPVVAQESNEISKDEVLPMKFDSKKTVFLIDGSSFLYRAYYGVRPLHTAKGDSGAGSV